jgi:hypothetical protein
VYRSAAADVGNRYDIRDGNDYYARGLAELDQLLELARPYPLPRRTSRK